MYPNQQNPYGPQPPAANPHEAPQQSVNAAPQMGANGQYDVLPPLPGGQNNGHTGHNPYEFIMNPNAPKRQAFNFGGAGLGTRVAILGGGLVVLMIVIAVVMSAFAPKGITPDLTAIAQRQQEIVRIATEASGNASGQDTQNLAITTQLAVMTSQQATLHYLAQHGTKISTKVLALDHSTQTDNLLNSAAAAGTYDSTVVSTLTDQLQKYESQLQSTYKKTSGANAKKVLQDSYTTADKLLTQAKSIAPTNP